MPARATTVIAPSFDELVSRSDCAFTGDVTALRSEWTGTGASRHIVTYITLNVVRTLKGEAASPFTLRVLGGTVGGETEEVSDAPAFHVGERQILFVHHNGRQFIPLVGIMHGQYHVGEDDRVSDHAGRPLARVEDIGAAPTLGAVPHTGVTAALRPSALTREEFEAKVIARAALDPHAH